MNPDSRRMVLALVLGLVATCASAWGQVAARSVTVGDLTAIVNQEPNESGLPSFSLTIQDARSGRVRRGLIDSPLVSVVHLGVVSRTRVCVVGRKAGDGVIVLVFEAQSGRLLHSFEAARAIMTQDSRYVRYHESYDSDPEVFDVLRLTTVAAIGEQEGTVRLLATGSPTQRHRAVQAIIREPRLLTPEVVTALRSVLSRTARGDQSLQTMPGPWLESYTAELALASALVRDPTWLEELVLLQTVALEQALPAFGQAAIPVITRELGNPKNTTAALTGLLRAGCELSAGLQDDDVAKARLAGRLVDILTRSSSTQLLRQAIELHSCGEREARLLVQRIADSQEWLVSRGITADDAALLAAAARESIGR